MRGQRTGSRPRDSNAIATPMTKRPIRSRKPREPNDLPKDQPLQALLRYQKANERNQQTHKQTVEPASAAGKIPGKSVDGQQ